MARNGTTFKVRVRITGVAEMRRAFRALPAEANKALRRETLHLSKTLAEKIKAAAAGSDEQSAAVARSIKAKSDRVPAIVAGGNVGVGKRRRNPPPSWGGRTRAPAHKVLFGANFGATHLRQFRPHRPAGGDDYWFFKTIEANETEISKSWNRVVDDVVKRFGDG